MSPGGFGPSGRLARAIVIGVVAWTASALGAVPGASAYPPDDAGFLDYAEMVAAIHEIEAANRGIVDLFTIGRSHEGRELWAAKVSDNVATDEAEPEVVFDAGIHAREHMTVVAGVTLLRNLVEGHRARFGRLAALVNGNEIFIFFNLNPDGSEYDHGSGTYRMWRKNRQPTPGSTEVGTDINRNFGYQWGTSPLNASPAVETYRGPTAWSTPEAAAFREWVDGRVVDGEQQVRVHVTLHQHGRVVLYPYGYTTATVAADMSADDHAVLATMAGAMGEASGYAAAQSSAWAGINVGNQMDWLYAAHGIFTFTIEMGDAFYMGDEAIGPETSRIMPAAYYAIERASCAYATIGAEATYCDPSGFRDIASSIFKTEIRWAAETGVTLGCARYLFCPGTPVNREQMASFLVRVLDLPPTSDDHFSDDDASWHHDDINRLASAGFTLGCGGGRYCPTAPVNREQMATFLRRAYALAPTPTDFFSDDDASPHEPDINRLAASGITLGCGPDRYCPAAFVTREQMVAFLYRAEH